VLGKDPVMSLLARALDGEALRQRVIANNIANLNTPGFKRLRVDFQAFMKAAGAGSAGPLKRTDVRHLPGRFENGGQPGVEQVRETAVRADGNNVDLDREMIELVENALGYRAVSQFWTSKFKVYAQVIRGGR
jgi:flagellar basal-body rod protein FlgB